MGKGEIEGDHKDYDRKGCLPGLCPPISGTFPYGGFSSLLLQPAERGATAS